MEQLKTDQIAQIARNIIDPRVQQLQVENLDWQNRVLEAQFKAQRPALLKRAACDCASGVSLFAHGRRRKPATQRPFVSHDFPQAAAVTSTPVAALITSTGGALTGESPDRYTNKLLDNNTSVAPARRDQYFKRRLRALRLKLDLQCLVIPGSGITEHTDESLKLAQRFLGSMEIAVLGSGNIEDPDVNRMPLRNIYAPWDAPDDLLESWFILGGEGLDWSDENAYIGLFPKSINGSGSATVVDLVTPGTGTYSISGGVSFEFAFDELPGA